MRAVFANALALSLAVATPSFAEVPAALAAQARAAIEADTARLTAMFKDIHQNPELGFMETRTAAIVAKELKALGFMDANAVEEATGLPYTSKVRAKRPDGSEVPVGHMCGHDAHVTWMLGMAKALVGMKGTWKGTVVLIGQPAEEPIMGARAMVDDGLWTKHGLPKPDFFIGMHTAPIPVGVVMSSAGPKMAGTDQLDVLFKGVGGHGSTPQLTKDPVLMAAYAVTQYQAIVSRVIDPQQTGVLTVGAIQAGVDNNVIPQSALVKANLRWFEPKVREQMLAGIKAISEGIARTYGMPEDQLPVIITMKGGSTPLVNETALASRLAMALEPVFGERSVITEFPPATGSEDIHLLKGPHADVPFDFLVVGVVEPKLFASVQKPGQPMQVPYAAHNPNFIVDLAAIPMGASIATISMLELLQPASK
jgi:hippurate hydrolase